MRQKSNNGFQKWLERKSKILEEDFNKVRAEILKKDEVYESQFEEQPVDKSYIFQSFNQLKTLGVEKLRAKMRKMDIYELKMDFETQFSHEFEMKYWRLQQEHAKLENELAAFAPLANLWETTKAP